MNHKLNKFKIVAWYGANVEWVFLLYQIPSFIVWQLYFRPIGQEVLSWIVVFIMVLVYYWMKRPLRKYCYDLIIKESVSLKEFQITRATSEYLLDSFDKEILRTLDELREEKGDYLKVFPALLDTIPEDEIIIRLAKLRFLGLIRVKPSRVAPTPAGLEVTTTPFLATRAILPSRFSTILARAQIMFDNGNLNGVMDTINILFEDILKTTLEERLGEKLKSTWKDLMKEDYVNRPLDRASLGVLRAACRHIGIISERSLPDILLGVFLKLRAPEKHLTEIRPDPERDARSALDLAQMFIRHWFAH